MYDVMIMVTHDQSETSDDTDAEHHTKKNPLTVQYDVRKDHATI